MPRSKVTNNYANLHSAKETIFPKTCAACGIRYESFDDFIRRTEPVFDGSGLMSYALSQEHSQDESLALYRNCKCQSTIMVFCDSRRDISELGLKRRQVFQQLLEDLIQQGVAPATAQSELIAITKGTPSKLLQELKFDTTPLEALLEKKF